MKGQLLSEKKVQTTFKTIEEFTCAMYRRKKVTSIHEARLDVYFKYKPNKNDNVLKGNVRKIDGGC